MDLQRLHASCRQKFKSKKSKDISNSILTTMKQSLLLSVLLALPFASNAATLNLGWADNLALSDGTLMTSGTIELGYFAPSTDFSQSRPALYGSFFQLLSQNISASSFDTTLTYGTTGNRTTTNGLTTLPYDLSTGAFNNANVAGDIAGGTIYALVYNGASFNLSTEVGVFSAFDFGWLWNDNDDLVTTTDFNFGLDSGSGMVAHIGTASADPSTSAHRLAAIPEPSRALLGLIGLTGVMFRRRRAAKA
jgi:hypothetical protein